MSRLRRRTTHVLCVVCAAWAVHAAAGSRDVTAAASPARVSSDAATISPAASQPFADASDRAAFRSWFVLLADMQFERPASEVTDCAALVRFAYREALRAHTPEWARRIQLPIPPPFPDVRGGPKPAGDEWPLFRISSGSAPRFAEFADARTIVTLNARPLGRETTGLHPGDLLYFRQPSQSQPDHLMVFVGRSRFDPAHADWVVYHTGPADGGAGEVRKVRIHDLRLHPALRWRPLSSNPFFVGVFRLSVL